MCGPSARVPHAYICYILYIIFTLYNTTCVSDAPYSGPRCTAQKPQFEKQPPPPLLLLSNQCAVLGVRPARPTRPARPASSPRDVVGKFPSQRLAVEGACARVSVRACVSVCLSICPSVLLSVRPSVRPSVRLSLSLSVRVCARDPPAPQEEEPLDFIIIL